MMAEQEEMIQLRNKKTGAVVTVPRSQFNKPTLGASGIGEDVKNSLLTVPQAGAEMIGSIPGGAKNVAQYATTNNPVSTLGNLGAGGVESLVGTLSAPQILARYLKKKFPSDEKPNTLASMMGMSPDDPTPYEALQAFENKYGMAPQSEQERSVRNLGGLMFGGKALTGLPNMVSRALAMGATAAGSGGDPVHAAVLAAIGEKVLSGSAKGVNRAASMNKPPVDIYAKPMTPPDDGGTGSPPPPDDGGGTGTLPPDDGGTGTLTPPDNGGAGTLPPDDGAGGSGGSGGKPPTLTANIGAALNGSPYMQALTNLPQAAMNISAAIPRPAKIKEKLLTRTSSGLEAVADAITKRMDVPGIQPLLGGAAAYLKHIAVPPDEMAKRTLFSDIDSEDIPQMIARDEAGKRLGLTYLAPSELTDSPFESAKQGNIGRTTAGSKLLYKVGRQREGSEESAINKLLGLIHTSALDPAKKAAYDDTMAQELPQGFIDTQSQRPVIQKALKSIKSNTAYRQMLQEEYGVDIDKVPANSFMLWDMVKRVLGDMEFKSAKDKPTEATVFGNTRRTMVREMDAVAPNYQAARSISERKFTRDKLEKVFDKKDKTFNNFDGYLKSDKNYNDTVQKLQAFPEALQQLKDIKLFSGKMVPNNPSTRAAAALQRTGMSDARNPLDAKKRALDEKYGQEHDVAAVKLMTNPDFMKIFADHLLKGGK